ncbi:MAG: DUF4129 domain-containing protein [Planctomycetes bacterium]|nr:DUF4129 domain-containing protein [Planctomycetota bacterium]
MTRVLLVCVIWWCAVPCAAQEDPRALVREILSESKYQTDLPGDSASSKSDPRPNPGRRDRTPRLRGVRTTEGWNWIVFGVGAGVIGVLILVAVLRQRGAPSPTRAAAGRVPPRDRAGTVTVDPPGAPAIPDAEEYAARGEYGAAVRALLASAIVHLRDRGDVDAHTWLTGREVLALLESGAATGSAVRELVTLVERSLFAGLALDPADYDRASAAHAVVTAGGAA